ncbi:MAG: hypothetical protein IPJ74_24095 [Saprospiraceae bacterium]|nr:hypothetical protein [Saprospiraceae bacterium]
MKSSMFLLLSLLVVTSLYAQRNNKDPRKAQLITADLDNFWKAFDLAQKDTAHAEKIYTEHYFDIGSEGLKDFARSRFSGMKSFTQEKKKRPNFYMAIRQNTLKVESQKEQIYQGFEKLQELYPDAIFPDVYFLIGRWTSGGTTSDAGLLIGVEIHAKSEDVPVDELGGWERNNFKTIESLPYIVMHESIHFQQGKMKNEKTLLASCIKEGMADFLCELAVGKTINERLKNFAEGRKKMIWAEFEKEMKDNFKQGNRWLYNGNNETARLPADLGYYIGYEICKSYYEEASDKKAAIQEMLSIKDYQDFLVKSKCSEKMVD